MLRVGYMHLKKIFFKKFTCQLTPTPNLASFSHFSSKKKKKRAENCRKFNIQKKNKKANAIRQRGGNVVNVN